MSVLSTASGDNVANALLAAARPVFQAAIWKWFKINQDQVILKKWGIISVTVGQLRPLIEIIAGEEPNDA